LLGDETHFLKNLLENPRLTGAVAPSGPHLAKAMARAVGAAGDGLIVELGPGTGPVTKALIEHGIARERLVLVEYDPGFCRLLSERFAPALVVRGDAYDLPTTLKDQIRGPIAAIVSSLPLLNQPPALREKLINDAFALMRPGAVFVQFTYGLKSPVPRSVCVNAYSAHCSAPIWRNLPPARVWTYRADPHAIVVEPVLVRLRESADRMGERWKAKKLDAKRLFGRQRARLRAAWKKDPLAAARRRRRSDTPPEV
jgi:phosphatidylethanolamine/phosphatidyl-N-methylethanolamine N-methyltransferase